ncbi:hypothetical protein C1645_819493 [Glomus cerebriforme]|uniref:Uncharacterized protein n=1 Tax=Glomus cerebriforme TaxID=658196 RepID=A0A397T7M5_9GLOM|nr:hypothetical protein C1645_819493 [Glomus cerebriforme]
MAKFYGETKTAEQLAEQQKVPRSIYEDLLHSQKCGICGEEPCKDVKRCKNNSSNNLAKKYSKGKIIGVTAILTILALGIAYLVAVFFQGKKKRKK